MNPIIEVEDLCKHYRMGESDVYALRGVSFQVSPGEFIALMGPSGSGKSTLMHLLGCLDTATSGTYCLEGRDVSKLTGRQRALVRNRQIGFVFQTFNLLARLSALENVMMPLHYRGRVKEVKERAVEALNRVGLADRLRHRPNELSGGQRQRVAIARALVTDPLIILADEPTGNLDSKTGAEVMKLLTDLNQERSNRQSGESHGRTIILVTHDAEVAGHAQRILKMHDGELVTQ
jgi:putative ABC transport system ATP-binding protein